MDTSCEVMFACVVPGFPNPLDTIDASKISVPAHVLEDICNFVRGGEGATSSGSMTLLPLDVKEGGENKSKPLDNERKTEHCSTNHVQGVSKSNRTLECFSALND